MKNKIGKNLKTLRDTKHLSQAALALKSGVLQQKISYLEIGKTAKVSWEDIEKLSKALDVKPIELTGAPTEEEMHFIKEDVSGFKTTKNTLILDPINDRKIVIEAPYTVTQKEFERLKAWLEVQLNIEE